MKLELSRDEMETLLMLAYLGEWMTNSDHPDDREARFDAVLQKLYATADEQGLGYLVSTDEESGELAASEALIAKIDTADVIAHYDDHVFWDELAIHLAERDLREEMGKEKFDALRPSERDTMVDARAEAYDLEFEKKGLDRLRINGLKTPSPRRDRLSEKLRKLFEE